MSDIEPNNLHRTYKGLAELLVEFNLDFDELIKTLREYYVYEAHKISKTITRTSLKIGIDRRTVSAILKNKKQYHKPSSIFTILNRIKVLAEKETHKTINKLGEDSVENIILEVAHGATTLNSVINELTELGCIVDKGEKIKFITSHISKTPDKQRTLQIFSNHLDRYVSTIITNLKNKEVENKQFEYSIYSTKVKKEHADELSQKSREILKHTTEKLRELYSLYEDDVPAGTYEEIGVSLTQFNLNKTEEEK